MLRRAVVVVSQLPPGVALYDTEHPFGRLRSAALARSPHHLLLTPNLLTRGEDGALERVLMLRQHCSQQTKHRCAISAVPATSVEHATWAAVGKVNSSNSICLHMEDAYVGISKVSISK